MSPAQLTKYFAFLDALRDSGSTNMWGASANVQRKFACGSTEAAEAHKLWMDTFDGETKLSERVLKALNPTRDSAK